MKHFVAGALIGISPLIWPDSAFSQVQECGTPGYTYPCPPPPPTGPRTRLENEEFRIALEAYRINVERERSEAPGQNLENYREALSGYRDGIENYREFGPEK